MANKLLRKVGLLMIICSIVLLIVDTFFRNTIHINTSIHNSVVSVLVAVRFILVLLLAPAISIPLIIYYKKNRWNLTIGGALLLFWLVVLFSTLSYEI